MTTLLLYVKRCSVSISSIKNLAWVKIFLLINVTVLKFYGNSALVFVLFWEDAVDSCEDNKIYISKLRFKQ